METEIVIVEDDPIVARLTDDILREAGYTTRVVKDCSQAEEVIRQVRPRLAILDVMIPGMDGITLLKRLRGESALSEMRILVVSGKSFPWDREAALRGGADLFIDKPYNPDAFPERVNELIGRPRQSGAAERRPETGLSLAFWGCRGASEGALSSRFGARTPCVALDAGSHLFVFDAGTGLVALGESLASSPPDKEVWLLLSHYHRAHSEGLGRFSLAGLPGRSLRIAGPLDGERRLKSVVEEAFAGPEAVPLRSRLQLFELKEEAYELAPGIRLSCMYAHHPGNTLALSLELQGRKLVYAPDSELYGEGASAQEDYDEKLARFCREADILIHDAQFTQEDHSPGSGHSSFENTLLLASRASVRELVLFHLNPAYPDERLERIEREALERAEKSSFRCRLAQEGLTLTL